MAISKRPSDPHRRAPRSRGRAVPHAASRVSGYVLTLVIVLMGALLATESAPAAAAPTLARYDQTWVCSQGYTCHYVDADAANDNGTGAIADPWKTIGKVNTEQANWTSGNHAVFFQRGDSWTDSTLMSAGISITTSGGSSYRRYSDYGSSGAIPVIGRSGVNNCMTVSVGKVLVSDLNLKGCAHYGVQITDGDSAAAQTLFFNNKFEDSIGGANVTDGVDGPTTVGSWSVRFDGNHFLNNNLMFDDQCGGANDSGAWGVLINGNGVGVSNNYFEGQRANSCQYTYDGAAIELYKQTTSGETTAATVWGNEAYNNDTFIETDVIALLWAEENVVYGDLDRQKGIVSNVVSTDANVRIQRTTINLSDGDASGIICSNTYSCDLVQNNIVVAGTGNPGQAFYDAGSATIEDFNMFKGDVDCPSGTGGCGGNDWFNTDPLLVSATNYHLTSTSPAIDRGDPTYTYYYTNCDRDGHCRPVDGNGDFWGFQDIGADEYVP